MGDVDSRTRITPIAIASAKTIEPPGCHARVAHGAPEIAMAQYFCAKSRCWLAQVRCRAIATLDFLSVVLDEVYSKV
jgi:hypothetical protein